MSARSLNLKTVFSIVFMTIATMITTASAKAQSTDSPRTTESRASALTEKMKTDLSLTETQYPQVQVINLKYTQKNEQIFKSSEGKFAKYRSLQSSQKDKNKEIRHILTSDQYKKYLAMVQEMKEKAREQYKSRS